MADRSEALRAVFVSATCEGERCRCGKPAVRKVGEEIPCDDPMPMRHNFTAYVCAHHYAELMGPLGAEHVGLTRPEASPPERTEELVERVALAIQPVLHKPLTVIARAALQSLGYAEMEMENARLREALACSQEHIRKMLRTRLASKTKHRATLRGDQEQGEG